jgi:hypothetical protein
MSEPTDKCRLDAAEVRREEIAKLWDAEADFQRSPADADACRVIASAIRRAPVERMMTDPERAVRETLYWEEPP